MTLLSDLFSSPAAAAGTALVAASLAHHVGTLVCAARWSRHSRSLEALASQGIDDWPPVTILKPLCGLDPELEANLQSFCTLDYPNYQIVFGALDPDDPALAVAERLRATHPELPISIVAGGTSDGQNRKACTLLAMHSRAMHDLLVIADSDMRVEADYLKTVVLPFADTKIGLVTCPYRGARPAGLPGVLEALGIGTDFIPSAFLAFYAFRIRFAFGSTIAIRGEALAALGGFGSLRNVLADDFALADGARRCGWKVHLSSYVVDDMLGKEPFSAVLRRRIRWARTARALRPGPYYGLFITYVTPLAAISAGLTSLTLSGLALFGLAVAGRMTIAGWIASRYTRDASVVKWIALLPISESLSALIWLVSLFTRKIHWRGRTFMVQRDGTLTPTE